MATIPVEVALDGETLLVVLVVPVPVTQDVAFQGPSDVCEQFPVDAVEVFDGEVSGIWLSPPDPVFKLAINTPRLTPVDNPSTLR